MINDSNVYALFFRNNRDELAKQLQETPTECNMWLQRASLDVPGERRVARQRIATDHPTEGEIAAVFRETTDGSVPSGIKIAIYPRNSHRQLIDIRDPNCDPMCFPLLFPYGERGYDSGYKHARETRVNNRTTLKDYYQHKFHYRDDNLNLMFWSGKLFQEFVVSSWIKIESNNLNYHKYNQPKLRIMTYQGLMNHTETMYTPENITQGAGRAFILPSTFSGSDRNRRQAYYDAMTIAKENSLCDIFVTFTQDPGCIEIKEQLKNPDVHGQKYIKALDRPDICSRVYHEKWKACHDMISNKHVLGIYYF